MFHFFASIVLILLFSACLRVLCVSALEFFFCFSLSVLSVVICLRFRFHSVSHRASVVIRFPVSCPFVLIRVSPFLRSLRSLMFHFFRVSRSSYFYSLRLCVSSRLCGYSVSVSSALEDGSDKTCKLPRFPDKLEHARNPVPKEKHSFCIHPH